MRVIEETRALPPGVGEIDAFFLASCPSPEHDRGRRLPCSSLGSFLYYLASPSARKVFAVEAAGFGVRLELRGPLCHDQAPLRVVYRVRAPELRALSPDEHDLLEERLRDLYDGHESAPNSPVRRLRELLA